ncbi:hypothetical protein DFH06DRAFT_1257881 [Mycena polygramma]|nr:hypothetical protein DFH06DRAFT_1257881 [Mycena polygramma]
MLSTSVVCISMGKGQSEGTTRRTGTFALTVLVHSCMFGYTNLNLNLTSCSPLSCSMPEIPQELVDAVIDQITDQTDIFQCALVSHSWLPRTQSHLFRTISLGVGLQNGFANGLVEIPPLGDEEKHGHFEAFRDLYIHTLNLGLPVLPSELGSYHVVLSPTSWQAIEDCVVKFLPTLFHLESLGLFSCGPQNIHSFQVQPHIVDALRTLSIRELCFSQWSFHDLSGPSCFVANRELTSLRFFESEFSAPIMPSPIAAFSNELSFLELCRCEGLDVFSQCHPRTKAFTWRHPRGTVSPQFSLLVHQTLNIVFEAVDPWFSLPLLSLCPFLHLPTINLTFFHQPALHNTPAMWPTWLTQIFTSITLKPGGTLHMIFIEEHPRDHKEWDGGLDTILADNCRLHLEDRATYFDYSVASRVVEVASRVVEYTFSHR